MLIYILSFAIGILVVALTLQWSENQKKLRVATRLIGALKIDNARLEYGAKYADDREGFEQGWEEMVDSYEQQFLTFNEVIERQRLTIEFQTTLIGENEADLLHHRVYCLPSLTMRASTEDIERTIRGLQDQLEKRQSREVEAPQE